MKINTLLITILIIAGIFIIAASYQATYTDQPPTETIRPNPVRMEGTITCLTKRGDGPQTAECTFGLETDDGQQYGLQFQGDEGTTLQTDQTYIVTGLLTPDTNEESIYDILGSIEVESIEEVETQE